MKLDNGTCEAENGMQWVHAQINLLAASGKLDFALKRKPDHSIQRTEPAIAQSAKQNSTC
jgi:hypothetical protein